MRYDDDDWASPTTEEIADRLMMPAAEIAVPLIAALFLVAGLAVHFGGLGSTHRLNSASNATHLRAAAGPQEDMSPAASNKPNYAG